MKKPSWSSLNSTRPTIVSKSDLSVARDVFLSSLKCEMKGNITGGGGGGGGVLLYSMIWIPILDPDHRYRPTKTISPVVQDREHSPGLSVCLYSLSVLIRLVC